MARRDFGAILDPNCLTACSFLPILRCLLALMIFFTVRTLNRPLPPIDRRFLLLKRVIRFLLAILWYRGLRLVTLEQLSESDEQFQR